MTRYFDLVPGYESLATVYDSAIEQASEGKGRERHAEAGEPYENQIICEVARRVGLGYPLGQAVKKIYESQRIGGERGVAELLGALNYVAAAVIVMREGMETAPKAEGGCFQNGNGHSPGEQEFKPGDPVEWFSFGRKDAAADGWHPAFYLCRAGDPNYHVVQDIDGMYHVVNYANIRSPEAMYRPGDKVEALSFDGSRWEDAVVERTEVASGQWHCTVRLASGERHCLPVAGSIRRPSRAGDKAGGSHPENPDSSTATQPKFQPGDSLLVTMPDGEDVPCVYVGESERPGCCCVRYLSGDNSGDTDDSVPIDQLRRVPVSKAEGCEALVEHDAPQTKEELYSKILESNPSTFGCAHKPTEEELVPRIKEVTPAIGEKKEQN